MHINRCTRTVPYLLVSRWNNSFHIELEDKVIVRTKDNKVFTGYVHNIGKKYLYLRTSGITYIAQSVMYGRCCTWDSETVTLDNIDKILKYPEGSQKHPNQYLGRKSTNNYYFRQKG